MVTYSQMIAAIKSGDEAPCPRTRRAFYGQFVTEATIQHVVERIGWARLIECGTAGIPGHEWHNAGAAAPLRSDINTRAAGVGEDELLRGLDAYFHAFVAHEAARQWLERCTSHTET